MSPVAEELAASPFPQSIPELPDLVHRWSTGESLEVLARECGITKEGLRKRIKSWCYLYTGDSKAYQELVETVLVSRVLEAEEQLEGCADTPVAVTRAREVLSHVRWILDRRLSSKFGPKQEVKSDTTIRVIVQRDIPQPVDITPVQPEISSQVIDTQDCHTPR